MCSYRRGFPNITGYDCASKHAITAPWGGVEQVCSLTLLVKTYNEF